MLGYFTTQHNKIPIHQLFASRCTPLIQICWGRKNVFIQNVSAVMNWKKKITAKSPVCNVVSEKSSCHVCWTTPLSRSPSKSFKKIQETVVYTHGCSKKFELKSKMCVAHLFSWISGHKYTKNYTHGLASQKNNAATKQKCRRANTRQPFKKHQNETIQSLFILISASKGVGTRQKNGGMYVDRNQHMLT